MRKLMRKLKRSSCILTAALILVLPLTACSGESSGMSSVMKRVVTAELEEVKKAKESAGENELPERETEAGLETAETELSGTEIAEADLSGPDEEAVMEWLYRLIQGTSWPPVNIDEQKLRDIIEKKDSWSVTSDVDQEKKTAVCRLETKAPIDDVWEGTYYIPYTYLEAENRWAADPDLLAARGVQWNSGEMNLSLEYEGKRAEAYVRDFTFDKETELGNARCMFDAAAFGYGKSTNNQPVVIEEDTEGFAFDDEGRWNDDKSAFYMMYFSTKAPYLMAVCGSTDENAPEDPFACKDLSYFFLPYQEQKNTGSEDWTAGPDEREAAEFAVKSVFGILTRSNSVDEVGQTIADGITKFQVSSEVDADTKTAVCKVDAVLGDSENSVKVVCAYVPYTYSQEEKKWIPNSELIADGEMAGTGEQEEGYFLEFEGKRAEVRLRNLKYDKTADEGTAQYDILAKDFGYEPCAGDEEQKLMLDKDQIGGVWYRGFVFGRGGREDQMVVMSPDKPLVMLMTMTDNAEEITILYLTQGSIGQ